MLGAVFLQIILIALNAIFACAELAVVSMNGPRLKQLAEAGDRRASRLAALTAIPARYLATIQVAITLAGFLGSAFAADSFADPLVAWLLQLGLRVPQSLLHTICLFLITLLIAYFSIVFGELVPKRVAMHRTESIALSLAGLLTVVSIAFKPLVWLLTASTNAILRLLHIDPTEEDAVTEEEIRLMVSTGSETGAIDESENEMIQNVFELNDIDVDQICTHRVDIVGLYLEDSPEDWDATIRNTRYGYYPIFGETMDDVEGVLCAKDYFRMGTTERKTVLRDAVDKPYLVSESISASTLLRNMRSNGQHFAVAIDEYGGLSGVATLHDLIEVLVGDFTNPDEAQQPDEIRFISDGIWEIAGMASLEDVAETLQVPLPTDEDYDTFGGFLCAELGEIPDDGATLRLVTHGLQIDILLVDDHRIEQTRVQIQSNTVTPSSNAESHS